MIRFLEANGYDVSYISGLDVDHPGSAAARTTRSFLSIGHDEYWSGDQRANVEAARDARRQPRVLQRQRGVLEDALGAEHRRLGRPPTAPWSPTRRRTSTRRSIRRTRRPGRAPGATRASARPATAAGPRTRSPASSSSSTAGPTDITVPAQYGAAAVLAQHRGRSADRGQTLTLGPGIGTLGYEWDEDAGQRVPTGRARSTSPRRPSTTARSSPTTAPTSASRHRHPSPDALPGRRAARWSSVPARCSGRGGSTTATTERRRGRPQHAAGDGQPVRRHGRAAGDARRRPGRGVSLDRHAPRRPRRSPRRGRRQPRRRRAGDDHRHRGRQRRRRRRRRRGLDRRRRDLAPGAAARPAGRTPGSRTAARTTTILARAVDDSGNVETPRHRCHGQRHLPVLDLGHRRHPRRGSTPNDAQRRRGRREVHAPTSFGTVTGIRFYKSSTNTGTHVGNLWTADRQLLAPATFTGETASGWQQRHLRQPGRDHRRTRPTSRPTSRPTGHYSQDEQLHLQRAGPEPDGRDASTARRCTRCRLDGDQRQRGLRVRQLQRRSRRARSTARTTGSTSSSRRVAAPPGQVTNVVAPPPATPRRRVSWTAPSRGIPTTLHGHARTSARSPQPTTTVTGNPPATSTVVTGLTNGTAYTFTVTASNPLRAPVRESAPSNSVTPSATRVGRPERWLRGRLSPWTRRGSRRLVAPAPPRCTRGTGSALLGSPSGSEPNGDSSLSQTVVVPERHQHAELLVLAGHDRRRSAPARPALYDWQEAQIRTTAGATLASIFKTQLQRPGLDPGHVQHSRRTPGRPSCCGSTCTRTGPSPPTTRRCTSTTFPLTGSQPTAPAAPTGVTATAGNTSATVSWTAPANGGSRSRATRSRRTSVGRAAPRRSPGRRRRPAPRSPG